MLRRDLIEELVDAGFREIVTVEPQENSYTVESLSREFPALRFVLLHRPLSVGAQINLAMPLFAAERVLVQWSTMAPPQGLERAERHLRDHGDYCVAPVLRGEKGEPLPVLQTPAMERRALRVLSLPLRADKAPTLFPFDYVGLYHRERFVRLGGFDEAIANAFWQKLDLGFRWYLFGGNSVVLSGFRMAYRSMPEPEDRTGDWGYARFFAKNLAVRVTDHGAQVPRLQVPAFALRSRLGIFHSIRVFSAARRWVAAHRGRFLRDARTVVDDWSVEHV